jgi:DNA-binding transcriptional LysR family regulator
MNTTFDQTKITVDQWHALISVVEAGGYAQAAEALHRAQSTVTYAVQKLESLLGVKVFEIEGRKAVLTATGKVLYQRAKSLVADAQKLERAAKDLAAGWEPELRIAAEILFPTWLLLECFGRLASERPNVRIELLESVMGGTEELLKEGKVHLAITPFVPPGFFGEPLMPIRMVAVAAPSHSLHQLGRPIKQHDLRQYRHLVTRDSGRDRVMGTGWVNDDRWTFSNKATSIRAAVMGLGYAWFTEETIREEMLAGALKLLPLAEGSERVATLNLIFADGDGAGPGTRRLAQVIKEAVSTLCKRVA